MPPRPVHEHDATRKREIFLDPRPAIPELGMLGRSDHRATGRLARHQHSGRLEICYIHRGAVRWSVGQEVYDLTGGDVYITFPGEPHGGYEDAFHPCRLYWLQLALPDRPKRGYLHLPPEEAEAIRVGLWSLPRRFPIGRDAYALFDALLDTLRRTDDAIATAAARSALVALLARLIDAGQAGDSTRRPSALILRAIETMRANTSVALPLAEVASAAGSSLSHFKALFRREVGMAPGQYYLRLRVSAAVEEISRTDDSLAHVAQRFGFSSSQYLATCVKRITGRPPSSYRQ